MEQVFLKKCENYEYESVRPAVFAILDGAKASELAGKGTRVCVKANLVMPKSPEAAATVHPAVVQAVCEYFVALGASVVIADSPGGVYSAGVLRRLYDLCGMTEAAEKSGAALNFDTSTGTRTHAGRVFNLIKPVLDADLVVSCTKLKTHSLTYFTGAVKNTFGTVAGANKAAYHAALPKVEDFSGLICDLCAAVDPKLSVIDGIVGMEGNGPTAGTPKKAGVLIAARNPYAADRAAMLCAGLDPELSPIYKRGEKLGLVSDPEYCGDGIVKADTPFKTALPDRPVWKLISLMPRGISKAVSLHFKPYPAFGEKCVGCGTCASVCPGKALTVEGGRAVLHKKKCIKCYCCHELCPAKAVELR